MNRVLNGLERLVDKAFDVIVVFVLAVGIYYAIDAMWLYNASSTGKVAAFKPSAENPVAYQSVSEDCVGWISIYNSKIDFPIMQGEDNFEYLNKDPYGAYSLAGSIFLDSRNNKNFQDDYSLVYGHHVEGQHMFGALDAFGARDYFDSHREGELVIGDRFYKIETFAYARTDASEGIIFNPSVVADRITWIRENADILYEPTGSRTVALSTCQSPTGTLRTILFVSIIE